MGKENSETEYSDYGTHHTFRDHKNKKRRGTTGNKQEDRQARIDYKKHQQEIEEEFLEEDDFGDYDEDFR